MSADRVLLVRVGDERFAFPLAGIIEAVDAPVITRVALPPAGVIGQCSHRGRLLPVLDLGALLGVARSGGAGALLVLDADGERAALLVDDVLDALVTDASMRRPVPLTGANAAGLLDGVLALASGIAASVDLGTLRATIVSRLTMEVG
jgi:chemotaxis signal transduction protein